MKNIFEKVCKFKIRLYICIVKQLKQIKMKATNNQVIDQFIIEVSLIAPIEKIINQLNKGEFRDCDIKWLDTKLENFIEFAAKTLGITAIKPSQVGKDRLNDYVLNQYLEKFKTLLNYFKNL